MKKKERKNKKVLSLADLNRQIMELRTAISEKYDDKTVCKINRLERQKKKLLMVEIEKQIEQLYLSLKTTFSDETLRQIRALEVRQFNLTRIRTNHNYGLQESNININVIN